MVKQVVSVRGADKVVQGVEYLLYYQCGDWINCERYIKFVGRVEDGMGMDIAAEFGVSEN